MRAMSNEIAWTFPAIKKQVDSLEESDIIMIERENNKFYIILNPEIADVIKNLYLVSIKMDIIACLEQYYQDIEQFYFGKLFGASADIDLVIIYHEHNMYRVEQIKNHITEILRAYFIETASIVYMSSHDWNRRYRLGDKAVLGIIRATIKWPVLHTQKSFFKPPLLIDPSEPDDIDPVADSQNHASWSKNQDPKNHTSVSQPIQPQLL